MSVETRDKAVPIRLHSKLLGEDWSPSSLVTDIDNTIACRVTTVHSLGRVNKTTLSSLMNELSETSASIKIEKPIYLIFLMDHSLRPY